MIAVDACLDPGPKRPFNFIGNLDENEILQLQSLANNSKDPIVWFGHYPTSCIFTSGSKTVKSVNKLQCQYSYFILIFCF